MKKIVRKIGSSSRHALLNLRGIIPDGFRGYVTVEVESMSEDEVLLRIRRVKI